MDDPIPNVETITWLPFLYKGYMLSLSSGAMRIRGSASDEGIRDEGLIRLGPSGRYSTQTLFKILRVLTSL